MNAAARTVVFQETCLSFKTTVKPAVIFAEIRIRTLYLSILYLFQGKFAFLPDL